MSETPRSQRTASPPEERAPTRLRRPLGGLLVRGGEVLLACGLVLTFFLVFMLILAMSFPTGTNLRDLVGPSTLTELPGRRGHALDLELLDSESLIARLSRVHRKVKDKPAGAIAWTDAHTGTGLADRHAIQTFGHSSATITFGEGNEMTLDGDSLIVLRGWEQHPRRKRQRASLVVLEGQMRASIRPSAEEAVSLEIRAATDSASARATARAGEQAEFSVKVNPDQSSTFQVYSGSAEIVGADTTLQLGTNQAVTVDASGTVGPLVALPSRTTAVSPRDGSTYFYREVPSRIRFDWSAVSGIENYRFVLARDAKFEDIVYETRTPRTHLIHGNLEAGSYFWRVSGLRDRTEGTASRSRRLRVVRDAEPPTLRVAFPDRTVEDAMVRLRGVVEPGSTVFIGTQEIATDSDGAFEHIVQLRPGINVVVLEAVDPAGNVSYRSSLIDAQF